MAKEKKNIMYFFGTMTLFIAVFFAACMSFFLMLAGPLHAQEDLIGPTITILSPTSSPAYSTAGSAIVLSGVAFDNVAVTNVTWENLSTGVGPALASGTDNWTTDPIALQLGINTIVVTAYDAQGNSGSDTITVNFTTIYFLNILSPTGNDTFLTGLPTITVGGEAIDGISVISWNNAANGQSGSQPASTVWSIPNIPLAPGDNFIQVIGF